MTRHPNAPKRPLSAYLAYVRAERDSVASTLPADHTFGDVGKALGARWQTLDDAAKTPYAAEAAVDRQRYADAMATYNPDDDPIPKKKRKKDPDAPKRASTSFLFFASTQRKKVLAKLPADHTFGDVGKALGAAWRALDDKKKSKFVKLAAKDRERYVAAKAAYDAQRAVAV